MAHPPDPALSRAVGDALRSLRAQGWSTRDIADRLGVADPTISRWENGNRLPAIELLPRLDDLCGARRGHVLRMAGYVDDDTAPSVESAVRSDPRLDATGRMVVMETFEHQVRRTVERSRSAIPAI